MGKHYIIPIFVPHYGCPHDCVFCNQKKITGLATTVTPKDVEKIIEEHLKTFKSPNIIEVAFYGGTFTAIDISIQKSLLAIPLKYKIEKKIDYIRLSTRPDAINDLILKNLKDYLVDTIELGVQSLDQEVLNKSGRGHSVEDVYKAADLIKDYGFNLGLQMMIGLPGDTIEKSINTCKEFIRLDPFCVRIYPTLVIVDTFLETQYLNNKYLPLSLEKAVSLSAMLLMMFKINDINVIRIGLQPTENIQLGKDVVVGPFHPSFRQLVETEIYKRIIEYYFKNNNINNMKKEHIIIEASKKEVSSICGQKSKNISYLKDKYGFDKVKVYGRDMDENLIYLTIDDFYGKMDMKALIKSYLQKCFND
ncbi:MAG TPA: radical SAM protein [Tissierellaceae bacterium]|nr:radical SAM protein [Tissierellaceae bacterium]